MWQRLEQQAKPAWQLVTTRLPTEGAISEESASGSGKQLTKTSCAMCHTEHHGRGFDIKLISDSRCQACHQRQFESLTSGHPEFKNFPIDRPRGIAFSHGQHARDHFPKKNRDFDCRSCHQAEQAASGPDSIERSLSFEQACASCHDQPIRAAVVDGWAALQLPSIEAADAVNDPGLAQWPAEARFGYDGLVSPMLRALLMADPAATAIIEQLPVSGKLVDVSTISSRRASVTKAIAVATKRLIEETAREGQAAWIARLERVTRTSLGREPSEQDRLLISAMVAGVPPDLFQQAQSKWLSGATSLAQSGSTPARTVSTLKSSAVNNPPTAEDDLLSGSSDDLLNESKPGTTKSNASADELLQPTPAPSKPSAVKLVKGATHLTSGGWYLDQTTLAIRYMPTGHADPTLAAWTLWWTLIESKSASATAENSQRLARQLALSSVSLDQPQPQHVADLVPGKCNECHKLESALRTFIGTNDPARQARLIASGPVRLTAAYYQAPKRHEQTREFTKFRHTPHLTLPALNDCRYCHQEKPHSPSSQTIGVCLRHTA